MIWFVGGWRELQKMMKVAMQQLAELTTVALETQIEVFI